MKLTDLVEKKFFAIGEVVVMPSHDECDYHSLQPVWQ
jgi:hypothetical protein